MKISNLRKENRSEEVALVADVESAQLAQRVAIAEKNTIWISVPKEYEKGLTTDRYDGFLVILLFCAMKYKEDIFIDGAISKRLMKNLDYLQAVLKSFTFYLHKINISVKETTDKKNEQAIHIGTGFGGGIDSFCTIYDKFECEKDPQYKIDTLVTFNTGLYGQANGQNKKQEKGWKDNFEFLRQFPNDIGLPFFPVNANLGIYIETETFWQELRQFGLCFRAGVALSLQNYFSKYYMASNFSYSDLLLYPLKDRLSEDTIKGTFMENIFFHLVSTDNLELIVDGSQYSRTEKTERVSRYVPTYKYLDVNIRKIGEKNKAGLGKVNRTLWALESLDKLDLYSDAFDIAQWKKDAFRYKCEEVIFNKYVSAMTDDNIELAKKRGKKVPPYFIAFVYGLIFIFPKKIVKAIIKAIDRRLFRKKLIPKIKNILK